MTKLTDLNGAKEALPKKVDMNVYLPITTTEKCVYQSGQEVGNNKARDILESVHIEVDVEAMELELCRAKQEWISFDINKMTLQGFQAKHLSTTIPKWARLVRK